MNGSHWAALGVLALVVLACGVAAWFIIFHFFVMAPHSRDRDYKAAYWVETELYYGSDCTRVMDELKTDGVVEPGLIECTRNPHFGFINTKNRTLLHVRKHFSLRIAWLPTGEKVIVDLNNGYVFWAKDGKVTNFIKMDPKLNAQLLDAPPEPTVESSAAKKSIHRESGGDYDGNSQSVQASTGERSSSSGRKPSNDARTNHAPTATPR